MYRWTAAFSFLSLQHSFWIYPSSICLPACLPSWRTLPVYSGQLTNLLARTAVSVHLSFWRPRKTIPLVAVAGGVYKGHEQAGAYDPHLTGNSSFMGNNCNPHHELSAGKKASPEKAGQKVETEMLHMWLELFLIIHMLNVFLVTPSIKFLIYYHVPCVLWETSLPGSLEGQTLLTMVPKYQGRWLCDS